MLRRRVHSAPARPGGLCRYDGEVDRVEYSPDRFVIYWSGPDFTYGSEDCSTGIEVELDEPVQGRMVVFRGREVRSG